MLVEIADGIALNTRHLTKIRVEGCTIAYALVNDPPPTGSQFHAQGTDEFPHSIDCPTEADAQDAYHALIDGSIGGS